MFTKILRSIWPNPQKRRAAELYIALVRQARNPFFYEQWKVADTVDGRFDMIVLHLALMVEGLEQSDRTEIIQLRNALMEYAIEDMDSNLRAMGVSDTSVSKKMKKLASALNGRFVNYREASSQAEWQATIARNVYRTDDIADAPHAAKLALYAIETREAFETVEEEAWLAGDGFTFGKSVPSNAPENTTHSDAA